GVLVPGETFATLSPTPSGDGYWVFTTVGRVLVFGDAVDHGDLVDLGIAGVLNGPIVDSIPTPDGGGYYLLGSDGGVFSLGNARFSGSMGGIPLNQPVNGIVPDLDNSGYWLVAGDGGVFSFDAEFRGSMGSVPLNAPVVGMVANGDGYLMVATDGGIFNFSDADFAGSLGSENIPAPIVSVAIVTGDPVSTGAQNLDPVARISTDTVRGRAPLTVVFDGSSSSDPDGSITDHVWNLGNGTTASGPVATTTYAAPGTYTASLTVIDDRGATSTSTQLITVGDEAEVDQGPLGPVSWSRISSETGEIPEPPDRDHQTVGAVFDVDGDGIDDFVLGGRRGEGPALLWFTIDAGEWVVRTIEPDELRLEAGGTSADIDGDGDLDFVVGEDSQGDSLYWWENPAPNFEQRWTRRVVKSGGGNQHHDQVFGDVDGDGDQELVFWNQNNGRRLFLADIPEDPRTTQPWNAVEIFQPPSVSEGLWIADIDLDGVDDIVGGGYWFRHETGTDFTAFPIDASYPRSQVSVGQLIEGGRPEVVLDSGDFLGPLNLYEWDGSTWVSTTLEDESRHGHSSDVRDVNGDGRLDILTGEMGIEGVTDPRTRVFYGDGTGFFTEQLIETGRAIHDSEFGDFDGDGWVDIVGKPFAFGVPLLDVWMNQGDPGPLLFAIDDWTRSVADGSVPWRTIFVEHGDIDGDGRDDVISGGWWWRNPGTIDGNWVRSTIGEPMNQMAIVDDFDGDGDLDVLGTQEQGSRPNSNLAWAENDGDGNFTVRTNIGQATGAFLQGAVMVELAPGVRQIALSWQSGNGGLQMVNIPAGAAIRTDTWTVTSGWPEVLGEELTIGDIDDDGDLDLMDGLAWYRNDDGTIGARFPIQISPDGDPDRNVLVDMNDDGRLDVVVTYGHDDTGRIRWFEQPIDPTGLWTEHVIDDIAPALAQSLDVADLDGDGDLDVLIGEHTNPDIGGLEARIYVNLGDDQWGEQTVHTGDEHHDGTQLFDVDDDGDLDIVSIGWTHRRLLLYENGAR
ncbi:MAG: FG-GAP-like repeat-containing protein, partial [Actinomycetota bacterium]